MPKIEKKERKDREVIVARTKDKSAPSGVQKWWKATTPKERAEQAVSTAAFLKEAMGYRYRQASIYNRLYSNTPLTGLVGSSLNRVVTSNQLPVDRPTMNVVQSCIDTLVSRITQSRPRPVFLTDGGDYKSRRLSKQLNEFIQGEFHQTKAYALGEFWLRDAAILGTGVLKTFRGQDDRVVVERVLETELLVDPNDAIYGSPRQMYQLKVVDREVLAEMFPKAQALIQRAENAYPDSSGEASKTVSDMVMVVEGWHLASGPDATDGMHIIACSEGPLDEEEYKRDKFPFTFLHYSPRVLGFFGQPLTEQLMGTQVEINKLLMTISQSINLVGVPRVFVEDGSKVVKAHLNNQVGAIVTYRGTKPEYEVAPCVPAEMYAQLQRLVEYAYQQSGISSLAAASQKPSGLDSGQAIREYDDLQTDRFAALNRRYDNAFIELAYQMIDVARDIAEATGSYQTVYPNKDGTQEIDLPASKLANNPFIIQCYDSSALPKDPAGRKQSIIEDLQAGMLSLDEARRLLDYPDLGQVEKLQNAAEERILKLLDGIVENGRYTPPDEFMDLQLAHKLAIQYYNLYEPAKLEASRCEMIAAFANQCSSMVQEAMAGMQQQQAAANPQLAQAEPLPTSQMIPQGQPQ